MQIRKSPLSFSFGLIVVLFSLMSLCIGQSERLSAQTPDETLPNQTFSDVPETMIGTQVSTDPANEKKELSELLQHGRKLVSGWMRALFGIALLPGDAGRSMMGPLSRWITGIEQRIEALLKRLLGLPSVRPAEPPPGIASSPLPPTPPAEPAAPPTIIASAAPPGPSGEPASASGPAIVVAPGTSTYPQGTRAKSWERIWKQNGMDGNLAIRDLPGNGGRPVAIYTPPGFDPAKPARVITYFHGHNGNIGEAFKDNGVLARLKALAGNDPNTVFVCPEAAQPPFGYWMKPPRESYQALQQQALGEAARMAGQPITVDKRIVSAHSGGGLALRNAVTSNQFAADRIEFLDCNYSDWGAVITRWAKSQPEGSRPPIESWNTAGDTRRHDAEIKALAPDLVTVHQSPVGHGAIPGRFLGTGLSQ